MIFEVKMFGLLILFLHVTSSICETTDDEHCSSGSDIEQDMKCKPNKDAGPTKYDSLPQSGNSLKESKYRETLKHEHENKDASALYQQSIACHHNIDYANPSILATDNRSFNLHIKE